MTSLMTSQHDVKVGLLYSYHCPIVWHFCGVVNNNKLEKIQERSLRILFSDYESDVHDLLDTIGGQTLA